VMILAPKKKHEVVTRRKSAKSQYQAVQEGDFRSRSAERFRHLLHQIRRASCPR
jgi:hypothetical protein